MGATEAAQLLGVDVRSLYAYVSRGALARAGTDPRRRSLYDSDEVELLASRGRPRSGGHPRGGIDVVIGSSVSTLGDGWVRYRGYAVLDLLARGASFENVAELLWTGRLDTLVDGWILPAPTRELIVRVLEPFDRRADVLDRMAAALAALNGVPAPADGPEDADAGSGNRVPDGLDGQLAAVGRRVVLSLVTAVGEVSSARPPGKDASVAAQLFQRLSPLRPTSARVRALDRALVLLADHELATSTLAVRVAASTRTSVVGALQAGLGAVGGTAHAGAAAAVRRALIDLSCGGAGPTALDLPGFGHPVHRTADPRAVPLLDAVRTIATPRDWSVIGSALAGEVGGAPGSSGAPNVDFALGALSFVARMPPRAATAIFAVARSAGWIAHASEEFAEKPLRYRARAVARRRGAPPSDAAGPR